MESNFLIKSPEKGTMKGATVMFYVAIIIVIVTSFINLMVIFTIFNLIQENSERLGCSGIQTQRSDALFPSSLDNDQSHIRSRRAANCPPCDCHQPHKTPIQVLERALEKGTLYFDTNMECERPHIFESVLVIQHYPEHDGKVWSAKAKKKQESKHAAAYKAIQQLYPQHLDKVAERYRPKPVDDTCYLRIQQEASQPGRNAVNQQTS